MLGFIFSITILGTITVFFLCKKYKEKYLLILCFITLLLAIIFITGSYNIENFKRLSLWTIIPFLIFIISSMILIVKNFTKQKEVT